MLLSDISDKQKTLLSNMSYLNIDMKQYSKLKGKQNITISDLKNMLENEDNPYLGDLAELFAGLDITHKQYIEELEKEGLGELKITDIIENSQSGFSAMSFSDQNNNVGISFRGTDGENLLELAKDVVIDVDERITGDNVQQKEAFGFFEKNKNKNGNNYLYGHSLGGNLAEHVYLANYKDIDSTFAINALPIDENLLNTDEKIEAFNNPDKFECVVVGGDPVSELDTYEKYSNNIQFVANSDNLNNNMLGNHLIQAASYDENGKFIKVANKEKAYNGETSVIQKMFTSTVNFLGTGVEKIYKGGKGVVNKVKTGVSSIWKNIKSFFGNTKDKFYPEHNNKLLTSSEGAFTQMLKIGNFQTNDLNYNSDIAIQKINNPYELIKIATEKLQLKENSEQQQEESEYSMHSGHEF